MSVMTDDEELALLSALVSTDGEIAVRDLRLGGAHEKDWLRLMDQGALRRIRHGVFQITEKGRIAAALVLHKKKDLQAVFFFEEAA